MKQTRILLFLLLTSMSIYAQKTGTNEYYQIDKKALLLPDSLTKNTDQIAAYVTANFTTDESKARAVFIWLASNIQYDMANMFSINFYEKKEQKIAKPLKTRKGICENYAALFTDICTKSGVKSVVVEGYTKQNGFVDYIPHAWCAALIDSSWFLFDPTWGSGYVKDGKFFQKINNYYFKTNPKTLVQSHMPFDYLWQFVSYPITNQEFYEGKTQQNKNKPFFSFTDSLRQYEQQNHVEQLLASASRVERNGVKNSLIFDRFQHLKLEIEHEKQDKIVHLYNSAVADYNDGVNSLNEFIFYRNKQFTPTKPDAAIQQMLALSDDKIKAAKTKLDQISSPDENTLNMIRQLNKSINDLLGQLMEQQQWLHTYLSKNKLGRKSMFYKVTMFGVPVN